jgi:hypothetical protein
MTKVRVGSSKEAAAAAARRRRSHHKKMTTTSSPSHKKIKSNDLLPVSTSGGNPDSASFDEPTRTRTRTRRIKVVKEHPSAARLVISSTDYTGSETISRGDDNHEEAFLIKSWEKLAAMRNKQDGGGGHKNLQAPPPPTLKSSSFVFQKRLSRIDWRTIHAIDVDQVIRDIGKKNKKKLSHCNATSLPFSLNFLTSYYEDNPCEKAIPIQSLEEITFFAFGFVCALTQSTKFFFFLWMMISLLLSLSQILIHSRPCSIPLHLVTFKVKTLAISQKQTL